jgi:hypothetical protein
MADTKDTKDAKDGPRQTISRMPDDQPDVGPYYPSGMSAQEALVAGADADLPDDVRASLASGKSDKKTKKSDD